MNEIKQLYEENANVIDDWRSLSRSELCNLYLKCKESNDPLMDNYLSAIICRFWGLINSNYNSQGKKVATRYDCYSWLIDSITYCLDKHVWTNPESSLYNDANGPEKAINVRISSLKKNFFYLANMQKRVLNHNSLSLEKISENSSDDYFLPTEDKERFTDKLVVTYVKNAFDRLEYFKAFTLDAITNLDMFDDICDDTYDYIEFSRKKLRKHLRNLDEIYCEIFATRYGYKVTNVIHASTYISCMTQKQMDASIDKVFFLLKKDKKFRQALVGEI